MSASGTWPGHLNSFKAAVITSNNYILSLRILSFTGTITEIIEGEIAKVQHEIEI